MSESKTAFQKPRPFVDQPGGPELPSVNIGEFTPHRPQGDVVPAKGADLGKEPKLIFVIGRGKTGKTTFLRWMAERALDADRPFLMADIDPTNASFLSYFADVARPAWRPPRHREDRRVPVFCDARRADAGVHARPRFSAFASGIPYGVPKLR